MKHLSREEAQKLCNDFIRNRYEDEEIADILVALADRQETSEEISGFVDALLENAEPFPLREPALDVCGTGGSQYDRFNVSTASAFVLASLGVKVAKHGNRGSRRPNGSFDLLEELGIPVDLDGTQLSELLDETGLAFIFARKFHPAMKNVVNARKIAGRRTIFNLAGPLSNPAKIESQIVGTVDRSLLGVLLSSAAALGRDRCIVVTGEPGIDELSISGTSFYRTTWDGEGIEHQISPEEMGIARKEYSSIPCGNSKDNALAFLRLVGGTGEKHLEEMVRANAALALHCGRSCSIQEGIALAREAMESKATERKFREYREKANKLSGRQD